MESPIETKPVALSPAELRYALLMLLGERLAGVFVVAWLGVLYFLAMQGELSLNGLLGTLGRWWPAPLTLGGTQVAILWLAPWTAMRSAHYQSLLRPTRYRLDAATLTIMPADADPLVRPYRSLRGTSRVRHLLALRQADGRYLLIPKRACRNPGELEAIQALLPPVPAPIEPQAAPGRGLWSDLAANLWTGLGLALLRPGSVGRLRSGAGQVPLLALVALLVGVTGDWLAVSGPAEIDAYAFEQQATQVIALMLGALWIAWLLGSTARWLPVLVLLLSLEPFFALGSQLLDQASGALTRWGSAGQALDLLLFLWLLGVWLRALRALTPGRPSTGAWGVLVLFALTILPFWWLPEQSFWDVAARAQREPRVNVEDTYYAQPELLERALDDPAPERPGRVDLYFLGFAGYRIGHGDSGSCTSMVTPERNRVRTLCVHEL